MIGQTLSHFKITAKLGEGGMGEVYRAEDAKLGREVAIKVLPEAVAEDPERLARFEREAKVLASLNHPGIAGIHQVEEARGIHFLVIELVEGEDLAQRIARSPLVTDDAIAVALQIAGALEAAHEKGIVHRDLKPANVMLTPEGQVKVLDFGLAKAFDEGETSGDAQLTQSPTLTAGMTQAGVILGTAAYMSPEQAVGKPVDKRADIWAFGCLLYEMLSGRHSFGGDSITETLSAIMRDEPGWEALPSGIPPHLALLMRRCLVKDPQKRLRDIGEARIALEDIDAGEHGEAGSTSAPGAPRWREFVAWSLAAIAVAVAATLALRQSASESEEPLVRFSVGLPEQHLFGYADRPILAVSPDGRSIAYVAADTETQERLIYVRALDRVEALPVPGTEGASAPTFSPDGESLAFFADGVLKRVPVAGGSAAVLASAPNPRGAVWGPEGAIFYSPTFIAGMLKVEAAGGDPEVVVEPDQGRGERTYRWPDISPDGRTLIYTVGTMDSPNDYDNARIVALSLDTGESKILLDKASMARFAPPNRLIFAHLGRMHSVPLDFDRMEVRGDPVVVVDELGGDHTSGASFLAVAPNGTLAYIPGKTGTNHSYLTLIDREGEATRIPLTPRAFRQPRFSPDGDTIAFNVARAVGLVSGDVWTYSLSTGALNRFSFSDDAVNPAFSPDGQWLAFTTSDEGIRRKPADGSGASELIWMGPPDDPGSGALPESWTPDGKVLALLQLEGPPNVYLYDLSGEMTLFQEDAASPVFSPDGRWIAYHSPAGSGGSIFVRSVTGDGKWQVSPDQGGYPRWSPDGSELFYVDIGQAARPLVRVDIQPGETFRAGPAEIVLEDTASSFVTATAPTNNWDISPDGEQFLFVELDRDDSVRPRIELILNWAQQFDGDD